MYPDRLGAVWEFDYDGASLDPVGRKNPNLRLVDDRHGEVRAERPVVGNRKRPTGYVVGRELPSPRAVCEVPNPASYTSKCDLFGPVDYRDDQAFMPKVHRDPQIYLLVNYQGVFPDRGVQVREAPQCLHARSSDERQVRKREPLLSPKALAPGPPHSFDRLKVDFVGDERVWRRRFGTDHVLGGTPAHV